MMDNADFTSFIARMSRDELIDARRQIDALLQFAGSTGAPAVMEGTDVDLVLDAITTVLRDKGVEFVNPAQLRRINGYSAFVRKVPSLLVFLRTATRNRNRLRALTLLSVELLYQNMQDMGVAVGARTLMAHLHRIPSVINRNFPGYAANGLLGFIVGEHNVRQERGHVTVSQQRQELARQRAVLHDTRGRS